MNSWFKLASAVGFLLLFTVAGLSAETTVGIHGGLSIPNIRGNTPQSENYVSRRGPFFGITADFGITSHFSICTELNYSSQGGKRDGLQPVVGDLPFLTDLTLYANFHNETILDYVEIPVMARMTWGNRLRFFVQAGPYIGFRARAVTKTRGTSQLFLDPAGTMPLVNPITGEPLAAFSFDADTNIKEDVNSTNAGLTAGAGLATKLGPGDLVLDVRFELGLTNIQPASEANGENQTGAVVVLLGYTFGFGERR